MRGLAQSLAAGAGRHGHKQTKTNPGFGEMKTSYGESKTFLGTMKDGEWALRIGWRYES